MTADRLATPEDLASLLERDDIDAYKAGVLVETATAIVQEAAGNQRIVLVTGDVNVMMGQHGVFLDLPQVPVVSVSAVTMDGLAVTDWKLFGNRLWRHCGWFSTVSHWRLDPATIQVTYTHGYTTGAQELQLGRGAVLSICQGAYSNPTGLKSESIDDYAATYGALSGQMESSPYLKAAIRRQYGRRAGLVAIGGS